MTKRGEKNWMAEMHLGALAEMGVIPPACTCCGEYNGELRPFDGGMVCADCDPARNDGEQPRSEEN